ncbi:complement C1q tumor necrosis factor-related protein 3-like [Saccostrea cucullata]|uniref:complement C1q tumor necrosis factor-related protein 3-like n=1 Tax=Saccostrea cuccullata TaxID=36930 RepID=UPI002ED35D7F
MALLFLLSLSILPSYTFLLDDTCNTLDCKMDNMMKLIERQQTIIDDQSKRISFLEDHLSTVMKRLEETSSTGVQITIPSFYAVKSRDQRNLAKGERILFETVITNVMKAFDVYTGVFKVPLKGTYAFSWSIAMDNIDNHACFSLVVNDVVFGQTYLWNNGSDAVSTGFSVVEVDTGDDVFMSICNSSQPLGQIISDIYRKTSFAGWCIAC